VNTADDPGWRPALRGIIYSLFPPLLFLLWTRKSKREPRLVLIRTVHVAVVAGLLLLLLSVSRLGVKADGGIAWWGWLMIGYPIAALAYLARVTRQRVVEADTIEQAASASVSGYFIVLGLASTPALFGHALVYIGGGTFAAVVGTLVSFALLWIVGPSGSSIAFLDQSRAEASKATGLTAELMRPQPQTPGVPPPPAV
jgi:hypothetical protein